MGKLKFKQTHAINKLKQPTNKTKGARSQTGTTPTPNNQSGSQNLKLTTQPRH